MVKIESLSGGGERFFSEAQLEPDPRLVAEGWERRFTADAQRAEEARELYSRLGYEVRLEAVRAEEGHEDRADCHSRTLAKFQTIYTRKKPA